MIAPDQHPPTANKAFGKKRQQKQGRCQHWAAYTLTHYESGTILVASISTCIKIRR